MAPPRLPDVPIALIGGRGPHGLAAHLWLADRGLAGVCALIDPSPEWLPTYASRGAARFADTLRSPRELDFALGDPARSMHAHVDARGERPLADVYALADTADPHVNAKIPSARRATRSAFHAYANDLARASGADEHVIEAAVTNLTPEGNGWRIELSDGRTFAARVVLLATGIVPHQRVPSGWVAWWNALPLGQARFVFALPDDPSSWRRRRIAVVGSSNAGAWEAAIAAARAGASVTLLCRRDAPIERQLPFDRAWFDPAAIRAFAALDPRERLRRLKKLHVPKSMLPGTERLAREAGVHVVLGARMEGAVAVWGGVEVRWRDPHGERAVHVDEIWAATGGSPRPRELPFLAGAVGRGRGPVVVGGPARGLPITDALGRWQNLPPLFPLGALALPRFGLAAATLASASVALPMILPTALADSGIAWSDRAAKRARDPMEVAA